MGGRGLAARALAGLTAVDFAAARRPEALARLDAALASAPKNTGLLLVAANALAADKNFARAETLLVSAIEIDPASLRAYSLLGRIYLAQKRLDASRSQFEKLDPSSDRSADIRRRVQALGT